MVLLKSAPGSIDCSAITGKEFLNWDDFQSYVKSSEKCNDLIDLSISEATSAIERHSKAQ